MVPNNANQYLPGVIQTPSSLVITGITNANPMVVTTIVNAVTEANTYISGQSVKLFVPINWGMFQANGLRPTILSVNGNQFSLNVDSTNFDAFVTPPTGSYGPPSLSPNGSMNLQYNNNTTQVPFQSLNNIGN